MKQVPQASYAQIWAARFFKGETMTSKFRRKNISAIRDSEG